MILLIDNYDSFSYNLVQLLGEVKKEKEEIKVIRNDEMTTEEIENVHPSHIILSPGPGRPKEAGVCEKLLQEKKKDIPILGVCLGHQAICEVYGAEITYAKQLMHGKQSEVKLDLACPIFAGMKEKILVARYHSLAANPATIPQELQVIAREETEGEIMAVKHKEQKIYGLQFHPESVLTPEGKQIIENFLKL